MKKKHGVNKKYVAVIMAVLTVATGVSLYTGASNLAAAAIRLPTLITPAVSNAIQSAACPETPELVYTQHGNGPSNFQNFANAIAQDLQRTGTRKTSCPYSLSILKTDGSSADVVCTRFRAYGTSLVCYQDFGSGIGDTHMIISLGANNDRESSIGIYERNGNDYFGQRETIQAYSVKKVKNNYAAGLPY